MIHVYPTSHRSRPKVAAGVLAFMAGLSLAGFSVADDKKVDLSEKLEPGSVWQGMSRVMGEDKPKKKKKTEMFETKITITARDGENVEFNYWITMGPNAGSSDRRGLQLTGTVDKNGQIRATPQKILAGAWQNPNLLNEQWVGQVVAEKAVTRMVFRRPLEKVTVEIGVVKKK